MALLYLLGGENTYKRNAQDINASAFQAAGGAPNVLVFPWARASFDAAYARRKRLFDYFRNLGASSVEFVDYGDAYEDVTAKMDSSDLLYLTGGLTSVLLERLKTKKIDQLLRVYRRVIVGRSAGAIALCRQGILTNRRKQVHNVIAGLGLADITIKVHYVPSEDAELKKLSCAEKIYAVPERSALICDNGTLNAIGDVYLFQNGEKTALTPVL